MEAKTKRTRAEWEKAVTEFARKRKAGSPPPSETERTLAEAAGVA